MDFKTNGKLYVDMSRFSQDFSYKNSFTADGSLTKTAKSLASLMARAEVIGIFPSLVYLRDRVVDIGRILKLSLNEEDPEISFLLESFYNKLLVMEHRTDKEAFNFLKIHVFINSIAYNEPELAQVIYENAAKEGMAVEVSEDEYDVSLPAMYFLFEPDFKINEKRDNGGGNRDIAEICDELKDVRDP